MFPSSFRRFSAALLLLCVVFPPVSLCASKEESAPDFKREISKLLKEDRLFKNEEAEKAYFDQVSRKALQEAQKDLKIHGEDDALALIEKNGGKDYKYRMAEGKPVIYTFEPALMNLEAMSLEARKAVLEGKACMTFSWMDVVFRPDGQGSLEVEVNWAKSEKSITSRVL